MIALKIFIFDHKLIQNGRFPVSNYVCLKEYYSKAYNFAGGGTVDLCLCATSPMVTTMITTVVNCTTNNNRRSLVHK